MSDGIATHIWRRARANMTRMKTGARASVLLSVALLAAPANQCEPTPGGEPTVESTSRQGPYTFETYNTGFDRPEFGAATIFYPTNGQNNLAGVAVAPGWLLEEAVFHGWGRFLASHGYVVITFSMNNAATDPPDARGVALLAAVDLLQAEGVRAGSPLNGRMSRGASGRYAIMGHSMGGGGTLVAARNSRADIKAAIPLTPWYGGFASFGGVTKPTLIFAGQNDTIAAPGAHAYPFYQQISTPPKVYAEFRGAEHFFANDPTYDDPNDGGIDHNKIVARMGLSWIKIHVDGDTRYRQFITGNTQFSRYETARF